MLVVRKSAPLVPENMSELADNTSSSVHHAVDSSFRRPNIANPGSCNEDGPWGRVA